MVAFTIGNPISYDRGLADGSERTKLGARPDEDPPYEGGWVWRTAEEARAFIDCSALSFPAAVYAIQLPSGWDEDVFPEPGVAGVHHLRNDATLLHRVRP